MKVLEVIALNENGKTEIPNLVGKLYGKAKNYLSHGGRASMFKKARQQEVTQSIAEKMFAKAKSSMGKEPDYEKLIPDLDQLIEQEYKLLVPNTEGKLVRPGSPEHTVWVENPNYVAGSTKATTAAPAGKPPAPTGYEYNDLGMLVPTPKGSVPTAKTTPAPTGVNTTSPQIPCKWDEIPLNSTFNQAQDEKVKDLLAEIPALSEPQIKTLVKDTKKDAINIADEKLHVTAKGFQQSIVDSVRSKLAGLPAWLGRIATFGFDAYTAYQIKVAFNDFNKKMEEANKIYEEKKAQGVSQKELDGWYMKVYAEHKEELVATLSMMFIASNVALLGRLKWAGGEGFKGILQWSQWFVPMSRFLTDAVKILVGKVAIYGVTIPKIVSSAAAMGLVSYVRSNALEKQWAEAIADSAIGGAAVGFSPVNALTWVSNFDSKVDEILAKQEAAEKKKADDAAKKKAEEEEAKKPVPNIVGGAVATPPPETVPNIVGGATDQTSRSDRFKNKPYND